MTDEKKMGRPTDYSDELADRVCSEIATTSRSLKKICADNPDFPGESTLRAWLRIHEYFQEKYVKAKRDQADYMVEECLDIADDGTNDTITKTNKNGEEYEVANSEWVQRSRLRVDTRKWYASKLAPKLYGEKITQEITGKDGGAINAAFTTELIDRRINDALLNKKIIKDESDDSIK